MSQSRIEILYRADAVKGRPTKAVVGDMTIVEALDRMLEGSGLYAEFTRDFSFVAVKPISDAPQDARAVPHRTYVAESLDQVVITGTLLPGVLDVTSPLQVARKRELRQAPYAALWDALQNLPMVYGGGPSEDFGTSGNFARGTSANLRGLGPGATLVLLNGFRLPYAGNDGDFVDLSSIPWSAVQRLEVLPDGASAQYGSDAIAGVVNIITRTPDDPTDSVVRLGSARDGAFERLVSQTVSFDWASGSAIGVYEFVKRSGLAAIDRPYAASSDKRPLGGDDYRSSNSSPGNILNPFTLLPTYGIPAASGSTPVTLSDLLAGSTNLQDREREVVLLPERTANAIYTQVRQSISDGLSFSVDARYSTRDVWYQNWGSEALLPVPVGNPHTVNPYSGVPFTLIGYSFQADLGPTIVDASTQESGGTFRVDATLPRDWRFSFSGNRGDQRMVYTIRNQVNASALQAALASTDPATAFNPWAPGTSPEGVVDAIRVDPRGSVHSGVSTASLVATGSLFPLGSGDVHTAIGLEWRQESFHRSLPQVLTVDRTIESLFTEIAIPLLGGAHANKPPRLDLSLSGRAERYSDYGNALNPKVGLRWAPSDRFKARVTYGTSFRAPKLSDPYSTTTGASLRVVPDPTAPGGLAPVLGIVGTRDDLTYEKARTWSAGIDLARPWADGFTASATYYSVDYKDRIGVPGPPVSTEILLNESPWSDFIVRHPTREQVLAMCHRGDFSGSIQQCESAPVAAIVDFRLGNMAQTRLRGVDLTADQVLHSHVGTFKFSANAAYIDRFEQQPSKVSQSLNLVGTVGYPNPLRLRGTFQWFEHDEDRRGFSTAVSIDRANSYRDLNRNGRAVDSSSLVNYRLAYRTADSAALEVALIATNIFNRAPPFVDREAGYDLEGADPNGRVVGIQIEKQW